MANIMQQVKLRNHTSRDGFDLSRKNAFSAKVGELLPCACIEVLPGDYYEGRVQHFTRSMPVSTAAYTRIREYYDWFFVPTNLLWNKFNTFVTQMADNNQHARSIVSNDYVGDTHPYFTTNQLHSYIREKLDTSNSDNDKNMFGFKRGELTVKLLNYLGYGDFTPSLDLSNTSNAYRENLNLNPFPLLAYQKIYQDYFRHSQWEQAFAPAFNIDYINGSSGLNLDIGSLTLSSLANENMLDLRYCNWNKDLFMGLLPNSQFGDAASIQLPSNSSSGGFSGINTTNIFTASSTSEVRNVIIPSGGTFGKADTANVNLYFNEQALKDLRTKLGVDNISILSLRQAEALQKWKEITQSQNTNYRDQVKAHFGVEPDNAYSERSLWIDGSVSNLDISEVTNTNLTSDNAANIAGKGVGVGDGSFKFKAEVHGYLMCIYHAVPLLDYSITGVNRMNLKTKVTDYAIPEFDRTGMVSVPTIELTNNVASATFTSKLLGYAPRYYDYKQAIDEVHGAFKSDFSPWVAPVDDSYITTYLASVLSLDSVNYVFFKVNPATLNPIFGYNVDSSVDSDQLLVNASIKLSAVRNLDRNGLPY
jgi:hypothetical protein